MTTISIHLINMRHKSKRYQEFKDEAARHNQSIYDKYGMPPIAQPPELPEDVVERIIKQTYVTRRVWSSL